MTKEQILTLKKNRLQKLEGSNKNIKCPGVLKRLRREIRNMEAEM